MGTNPMSKACQLPMQHKRNLKQTSSNYCTICPPMENGISKVQRSKKNDKAIFDRLPDPKLCKYMSKIPPCYFLVAGP